MLRLIEIRRALAAACIVLGGPLVAEVPITQQAYLKAHNAPSMFYFGGSVATSGDTIVVSAVEFGSDQERGAAYVFGRQVSIFVPEGQWTQQAQLKTARNVGIGSCAISGDTIVLGAAFEDSNATGVNGNQDDTSAPDSGAAYVFVREGTEWTPQAYLKASNTGAGDLFGISVAISGDTIVVAAQQEDSNGTGVNGNQGNNSARESGAAYVFVRRPGIFGPTWTQQAYLKASNAGAGKFFATSVSISGDTIVVGADSGAAYVFVRNGTEWTQQAILNAGPSVAISGDTVVVGAYGENGNAGAAYIFVREHSLFGPRWTRQASFKPPSATQGDDFGPYFGFSVGVSGDRVLVGAPFENVDGTSESGAAYLFERSGNTWSPHAYFKASNPGFNNFFGYSVALSGNTIIVGARGEDSSTTGVNSTPNNNPGGYEYGAVYVFASLVPPPPLLDIRSSGDGGVRLYWPLTATGWVLEQSETMESASAWVSIPAPYGSDATGFFHSMPVPANRGFFRLREP